MALFLGMMAYIVYFNVVEGREIVNSPYNTRQDSFADRVLRGSIVDADGNILAETETAEDGTETRYYPYGEEFAHVVGYASQGKS
ncbi:MAG: penicillin-binding protein 2, partial [Hespellia sp.]|nr:penicillin-binding protein 2 [Hespellia sp.]